jgi:hypothetical protein
VHADDAREPPERAPILGLMALSGPWSCLGRGAGDVAGARDSPCSLFRHRSWTANTNHAKTKTEIRFQRSQILGISSGNVSKFEQVLDSYSNRIRGHS